MLLEQYQQNTTFPGNLPKLILTYQKQKDFICKQCGVCCTDLSKAFSICANEEDVQLWDKGRRDDILDWVDSIQIRGGEYVHTIWVDPTTGMDVTKCPWLKRLPFQNKYICQIHDAKPVRCREYPKSKKDTEEKHCQGFES